MSSVKLRKTVIRLVAVLAILVSSVAWADPSKMTMSTAASTGSQSVIFWNGIMLRTVITNGLQSPPASFVYGTYVHAAVYNAVVAIEGGYHPYKSNLPHSPYASVEAAIATAAHDVLVHYFPLQQIALDAEYASFLAAISDGVAKTAGVQLGASAATELITLRAGDGLNANTGFTMPAPAPGVWQLPAGVSPLVPWMSRLRPFMLESTDQFRPGPPPALNSQQWAVDYNEVLQYGRRDSLVRTAEQTDIARFWTSAPLIQYNVAFQQIANTKGLGALEAARLMVMGNMVGADAEIGCFEAKFRYLFWRPAFAIPQGDTDGNPATQADATFVPLLNTPAHPDYPSSHSCLTSSEAEVFAAFLDTQRIEVDIISTVPGLATRHFTTANQLTQDIINARVWGGIHFRTADVMGANLGRKVAHWTLQRYFLPDN